MSATERTSSIFELPKDLTTEILTYHNPARDWFAQVLRELQVRHLLKDDYVEEIVPGGRAGSRMYKMVFLKLTPSSECKMTGILDAFNGSILFAQEAQGWDDRAFMPCYSLTVPELMQVHDLKIYTGVYKSQLYGFRDTVDRHWLPIGHIEEFMPDYDYMYYQ